MKRVCFLLLTLLMMLVITMPSLAFVDLYEKEKLSSSWKFDEFGFAAIDFFGKSTGGEMDFYISGEFSKRLVISATYHLRSDDGFHLCYIIPEYYRDDPSTFLKAIYVKNYFLLGDLVYIQGRGGLYIQKEEHPIYGGLYGVSFAFGQDAYKCYLEFGNDTDGNSAVNYGAKIAIVESNIVDFIVSGKSENLTKVVGAELRFYLFFSTIFGSLIADYDIDTEIQRYGLKLGVISLE